MTRTVACSLVVLAAASLAAEQNPARPEPPRGSGVVALTAARMIDGTGRSVVNGAVIIVTGDRITAAGPASSVTIPAGASVMKNGMLVRGER